MTFINLLRKIIEMNLKISECVFEKVPSLCVGVLVLEDVNNKADMGAFFDSEYAKIEAEKVAKFDGVELAEYPLIRAWRDIYKGFGEKKARSSIEALIRRVVGGKGLYRISALVDIYNLASLRFELPCGGEDLDTMPSVLELTVANGTEKFLSLGATEYESPNTGEIIYKSGDIVVCRNFNYRESDITKLTENTKRAIVVFEDVTGGDLEGAMEWFVKHVTEMTGARVVRRGVLSK